MRSTRFVLGLLDAFLALAALAGAVAVVPYLPAEWLAGSVFPDYTIPALGLASVGVVAALAAVALAVRRRLGAWLSGAAGVMIIVFEVVEIMSVGLTFVEYGPGVFQSWLQPCFLLVGLAQGVLALRLLAVRRGRPAPLVA